jgi:hypothetical protein
MRSFFKTCRVHHCHSPEMGEPLPKKCRCRKLISRDMASDLVKDGIANWMLDYSGEVPIPTWNIVLSGRVGKTPRAKTIEKADLERYTERMYNPNFDSTESQELINQYHDIEMETRLSLFGSIGSNLLRLKKDSDTYGNLEGVAGKVLVDKLMTEADSIKRTAAKDDQYQGRAIFTSLGNDQRTVGGVGKTLDKPEKS